MTKVGSASSDGSRSGSDSSYYTEADSHLDAGGGIGEVAHPPGEAPDAREYGSNSVRQKAVAGAMPVASVPDGVPDAGDEYTSAYYSSSASPDGEKADGGMVDASESSSYESPAPLPPPDRPAPPVKSPAKPVVKVAEKVPARVTSPAAVKVPPRSPVRAAPSSSSRPTTPLLGGSSASPATGSRMWLTGAPGAGPRASRVGKTGSGTSDRGGAAKAEGTPVGRAWKAFRFIAAVFGFVAGFVYWQVPYYTLNSFFSGITISFIAFGLALYDVYRLRLFGYGGVFQDGQWRWVPWTLMGLVAGGEHALQLSCWIIFWWVALVEMLLGILKIGVPGPWAGGWCRIVPFNLWQLRANWERKEEERRERERLQLLQPTTTPKRGTREYRDWAHEQAKKRRRKGVDRHDILIQTNLTARKALREARDIAIGAA